MKGKEEEGGMFENKLWPSQTHKDDTSCWSCEFSYVPKKLRKQIKSDDYTEKDNSKALK